MRNHTCFFDHHQRSHSDTNGQENSVRKLIDNLAHWLKMVAFTSHYIQCHHHVARMSIDNCWYGFLLSMTKIPPVDILEGFYKLRVRESDKLKTVLELYGDSSEEVRT